ncbi:citrate lyase subunit beta / citryl-CoA lyase [Natronoarchaeum philippinense]|uniref:Citrate lyase subunit beta / citryl-CoA lyase n=1 Tax=Natronoarchaeum philippinense TaxID=558529 RepID=A0A285NVH6_NATPI|nr:CoA ester lyase [Natronoarchaeum philippinense]SNZ13470.1 citrate lyase subunit beta / citryl-CoA lyase [Natronoarchaeum philippinense]
MTRRSLLFTPGDREAMLRKAPTTGADIIAFDLEDAVAPADKDDARQTVADVLTDPSFDPDCEVFVRTNPLPEGRTDLAVVLDDSEAVLDGLIVPKASSAASVTELADAAAEHGRELPVLALVESAAGVLAAPEIAAATPTDGLLFGAEDLAADLGATRTSGGTEVLYARERVVAAARAAGVDAIDTLYTAIDDEDGLREDAAFARQLGYDGKMAIHPAQVDPIHDAMTPDAEQIEWARRVLDARPASNTVVYEVDGEMIDAPLIRQAERILSRVPDDESDTGQ